MADPKTNPPRGNPDDEAIDAELQKAVASPEDRSSGDLPLKRLWDDDLEAELQRAMEGFDASSFDVATKGRTRASDRSHVAKGDVGQETREGPQQGKVIAVRGRSVFIDLGAKSEGVVPVEQFQDRPPAPGDFIEVLVDRFDPAEGILLLNLKGATVEANWENLRKGLVVEARGTKAVKGGLEVDVDGIRGFMPISQIDLARVEDAADYVGKKLRAVVTEVDARQKNLVVSSRDLLETERAELRETTWAELEVGQIRQGVVRSVRDFGAFVDVGGVDGLIHAGDMSWVRVSNVADLIRVGQEVEVKVLKIDRVTNRVGLGLKQLMPSPWDRVDQDYKRGMVVQGKVTKLMDFGAFVELEPGLEGLIHISELSTDRVHRVADVIKLDQEVEVRILKIEPDAKRISLSLRPLPGPSVKVEPDVEDDDDTPPAPKPVRKIPLKGGLGDRDPKIETLG